MDYKEILKGIVNIINTTEKSDIGFANICFYIGENCPELKESEDEKIRKDIMILVNDWWDRVNKNNISTKEQMLAWLEKQGNHKPVIVDFKAKDWCVSEVDGQIHDMTYNPANKVKPNFKLDDWIIFNGFIIHIDEVVNGYYRTTTFDGIPNSYSWDIDNVARLWSIQDAKDGDVLVSRSPFIYGKQCPYGGLNWANDKFIKASNFIFTDSPVHPATKEECNLLFQKMKEAGYQWDAKNKELKKIK